MENGHKGVLFSQSVVEEKSPRPPARTRAAAASGLGVAKLAENTADSSNISSVSNYAEHTQSSTVNTYPLVVIIFFEIDIQYPYHLSTLVPEKQFH